MFNSFLYLNTIIYLKSEKHIVLVHPFTCQQSQSVMSDLHRSVLGKKSVVSCDVTDGVRSIISRGLGLLFVVPREQVFGYLLLRHNPMLVYNIQEYDTYMKSRVITSKGHIPCLKSCPAARPSGRLRSCLYWSPLRPRNDT